MEITAEGQCKKCGLKWKTVGGDGKALDTEVHFILNSEMTPGTPCKDCVEVFTLGQSFA